MGLKYGPQDMELGPRPRKMPFAASQKFHELGGAFVHAASGNMTLTLTATAYVFGWAMLGFGPDVEGITGSAGSRYWTSSATAGTKYSVKPLSGAEVLVMPGDDSFVSATHRGNACDLIGVNDGTVQQADIGTSTTDILRILGAGSDDGGSATEIVVMVNPAKLQAVT